jgi:hypothetical protein
MPWPLIPPGKTQYPLYRRLGGPQGLSGWVQKISPPPGFDPGAFHLISARSKRCVIIKKVQVVCAGGHIMNYTGLFKMGFSNLKKNIIFIFALRILNVKIPVLKPTDAHFCNYINSKNRLELHYTLRHVSVRAGTILGEFPSA